MNLVETCENYNNQKQYGNMTTSKEKENKEKISKESPDSVRQPIWHVCVLGFFSFGLYIVFWFYKTIRDLKTHAKKLNESNSEEFQASAPLKGYLEARPGFRTLAFFIPLLEIPLFFTPLHGAASICIRVIYPLLLIFLFANLFKDIASLIPDKESRIKNNPVQAALALVFSMPFFLTLAGAKGLAYLLYLLVVIPIAIAQKWLNQYWLSVEGEGNAMRTAFTPMETIMIIIGALWMGLVLFKP